MKLRMIEEGILLLTLSLSACMATYHPTTAAGAKCKIDCSINACQMSQIRGTCVTAYNACVSGCKDMDRIAEAK